MDNFDLRKYLAEGKLLKEVMDEKMEDYVSAMYDSDVDQEAEEGFQSDVWSKAEYASNAYTEESVALFLELIDHLKSVGGKDVVDGNPDIELELLPNGDIKWSADVTFTEGKLLKENIDYSSVKDEMKRMYDIDVDLDTIEDFITTYNDGEGMDVFDTTEREDFYLYLKEPDQEDWEDPEMDDDYYDMVSDVG